MTLWQDAGHGQAMGQEAWGRWRSRFFWREQRRVNTTRLFYYFWRASETFCATIVYSDFRPLQRFVLAASQRTGATNVYIVRAWWLVRAAGGGDRRGLKRAQARRNSPALYVERVWVVQGQGGGVQGRERARMERCMCGRYSPSETVSRRFVAFSWPANVAGCMFA